MNAKSNSLDTTKRDKHMQQTKYLSYVLKNELSPQQEPSVNLLCFPLPTNHASIPLYFSSIHFTKEVQKQ